MKQVHVNPKRVYLAGPMAGYEDFNFPLFKIAGAELKRHFDVVNPIEMDHQLQAPANAGGDVAERAWYLKRDFAELLTCDVIALLPGWQESTGASAECAVAMIAGMEVWEFEEDDKYGLVLLVCDDPDPSWQKIVLHAVLATGSWAINPPEPHHPDTGEADE